MKTLEAYDVKAEKICRCTVLVPEGEPEVTIDGTVGDEEALSALQPWEKTLLSLLKEDLFASPMFDGERISASRGHLTVSLPARRAEEDGKDRGGIPLE